MKPQSLFYQSIVGTSLDASTTSLLEFNLNQYVRDLTFEVTYYRGELAEYPWTIYRQTERLREAYGIVFLPVHMVFFQLKLNRVTFDTFQSYMVTILQATKLFLKPHFNSSDYKDLRVYLGVLREIDINFLEHFQIKYQGVVPPMIDAYSIIEYFADSDDAPLYYCCVDTANNVFQTLPPLKTKETPKPSTPAIEVIPPAFLLSQHQNLLQSLDLHYTTKKLYPYGICGIPIRPYPLIVGPSGVGKTHLVKVWARQHQLPLLIVDSGCWYPVGSHGGQATLADIREFLEFFQGDVVILIDEIDKFRGGSSWSRSLQQELYTLLDKRLERLVGWTYDTVLLLEKAFIIGAGTWQKDYQKKSRYLDSQEVLDDQKVIPQELLYRFNVNTLFLHHLSEADFRRFLVFFAKEFLKEPFSKAKLAELASTAAQSNRNFRWIEAFVTENAQIMAMGTLNGLPELLAESQEPSE